MYNCRPYIPSYHQSLPLSQTSGLSTPSTPVQTTSDYPVGSRRQIIMKVDGDHTSGDDDGAFSIFGRIKNAILTKESAGRRKDEVEVEEEYYYEDDDDLMEDDSYYAGFHSKSNSAMESKKAQIMAYIRQQKERAKSKHIGGYPTFQKRLGKKKPKYPDLKIMDQYYR